jgi:hypothetical protein
MNKEAFERGFLKAALYNGVNPMVAVGLLKHAGVFGRYFDEGAIPHNAMIDQPYKSEAASLPGRAINTAALIAPPGISNAIQFGIGMPIGELGMAAAFGNKDNREKKYRKSLTDMENRGYRSQMNHSGDKLMVPEAILGGLVGAGAGAYIGRQIPGAGPAYYGPFHAEGGKLRNSIIGAALGTLAGGTTGYLNGALAGGWNKFVTKHTSEDSKERALKMKARHPYLTSLPFGDMVGAVAS